MTELAEYLLSGVLLGAIYGVLALPICLLFSSTGYIDLAVGAYAVLAAAFAHALGGSTGIVLGVLVAILASAATGLISLRLDRLISDHITVVLASYGVAVFIESYVLTFFGEHPMIRQSFDQYLNVGGTFISPQGLVNLGLSLLILLAVYLTLFRTPLGRIMRASAINATGALLAGISVRGLWFSAYLAGGLLSGVAGILVLYTSGIDYHGGLTLLTSAFGAAIILGINHPLRGFLGGLVMGVVQSLSTAYLPGGWVSAVPSIVTFAVLAFGSANLISMKGGRP